MFDLRVVLPASPSMIRAWLIGLVDRILPINPDPEGWGQPQISPHAFTTDATLRPQAALPEIEAAGGFATGLEIALQRPDGLVQPMGPVVVFMVVPMGHDRSELRIFFPLGLEYESRPRMADALREAWPGVPIYVDQMPWWMANDFNRRALFTSIATGGPLPPGAPPPTNRSPLPWRDPFASDHRAEKSKNKRDQRDDENLLPGADDGAADPLPPTLKGRPRQIVRLLRQGRSNVEIAKQLGISKRSVEKRIIEARKEFGPDIVPYRRLKQAND